MSRKIKCMKMKLRCNTLRKDSIAMVYVIGSFLSWGPCKDKVIWHSPRSAGWSWRLELKCCERKILLGWLELELVAGVV